MRRGVRTNLACATMFLMFFSVAVLAAGAEHDADRARVNYMLHCQGCHLPDGRGFPGRVPDMRYTLTPLLHVEGGREFIVQVPGTSTSALQSDELAELLNWMIDEFPMQSPDNSVADFTAEEVEGLRKTPLVNVTETRSNFGELVPF